MTSNIERDYKLCLLLQKVTRGSIFLFDFTEDSTILIGIEKEIGKLKVINLIKSQRIFKYYNVVCEELSQKISIYEWLKQYPDIRVNKSNTTHSLYLTSPSRNLKIRISNHTRNKIKEEEEPDTIQIKYCEKQSHIKYHKVPIIFIHKLKDIIENHQIIMEEQHNVFI